MTLLSTAQSIVTLMILIKIITVVITIMILEYFTCVRAPQALTSG